jgi:hypothetical protein
MRKITADGDSGGVLGGRDAGGALRMPCVASLLVVGEVAIECSEIGAIGSAGTIQYAMLVGSARLGGSSSLSGTSIQTA